MDKCGGGGLKLRNWCNDSCAFENSFRWKERNFDVKAFLDRFVLLLGYGKQFSPLVIYELFFGIYDRDRGPVSS